MSVLETRYEHVVLNEGHVPLIADTNMKVEELVLDAIVYHWSPEALQTAHPSLTLGQIHSALAYYYDHKAEMDTDIERGLRLIDDIQRNLPDTQALRARITARGPVA